MFVKNAFCIVALLCFANGGCMRISGKWSTSEQPLREVAEFGVQPVDPLMPIVTRAFVYGNVTDEAKATTSGDAQGWRLSFLFV